jgi:hypothetical protein
VYPISDAFAAALRQPHTIVTRAEVLNTNFVLQQTLSLTQGNVQVDGKNAIRRSASMTLVDDTGELVPGDLNDLTHPLAGHYIRLFRGIRLPGGDELISIGVFDIFDNVVTDTGKELKVEIKAFDLAKRVQRSRLTHNYVVPVGTRYDLAIRDLISYVAPWVSFNFATVDVVTPFGLVFGSSGDQAGGDPWKYAQEMAESIGHELYFDIQGVCRLTPVANAATDPVVWEYHEGEDSQLLYVTKTISKEDTFNHVFAFGENSASDNPIKGEAWDDDPNSPTYRFGPYGSVPTFLVSPYIATANQAQMVAEARLRQTLGATEGLRTITTANPAHEVGDVVTVRRLRAKIDSKFVLDKFNINLAASQAINATMREVRSGVISGRLERTLTDSVGLTDTVSSSENVSGARTTTDEIALIDSLDYVVQLAGERVIVDNVLMSDSLSYVFGSSVWTFDDEAWTWSATPWSWST